MNIHSGPYSALEYDQGIQQTIPYIHNFYAETVDLVKQVQPEVRNWLDIGCKTGTLLRLAYPAFRSVRFIITDPSQDMLMQARLNLAGMPPNQLMVAGAFSSEALELTGYPCPQVISAILAHDHLDREQHKAALRNCYEMLDEQGVYIAFEHIRPRTLAGRDIERRRSIAYQMAQGKSEAEALAYADHCASTLSPLHVDEHIALLQSTGFETVELFWRSHLQAGFYAIKG